MPEIHQTENFLEKKENLAWNLKQRIGILVERNEIITTANMFSFASRSYWPISEGKKNLIRELRYRGEEKHGEKREERQRERSMGRWETRVSDSEGVRREKVRKLTMRERRRQKIMFPTTINFLYICVINKFPPLISSCLLWWNRTLLLPQLLQPFFSSYVTSLLGHSVLVITVSLSILGLMNI